MKLYDVYRYEDFVARIRLQDGQAIEWAYHQENAHGQGFWWSNSMKYLLEEFILRYPDFEELVVAEFTLRQSPHQS